MTTATRTRKTTRKPVSEAEKNRRIEARKAKTEALHAALEGKVSALASSDEWAAYLKFAKSLNRYSFTNLMLIFAQCPTATNVAGYGQWQEKGRQVITGGKSIGIYGFGTRRVTEEDEKTGEKTEKRIKFYPIRYVFDVADTVPITEEMLPKIKEKNPKAKVWAEIPEPTRLLEGEDEHGIAARVAGMVASLGWAFQFETITNGSNGYTTLDGSKRVVVRDDMDPAAQAKTALHELGHLVLHADAETGKPSADNPQRRDVQELEAESVAYVVAGALGLDTAGYSIGYLASWSKGDGKAVAATAERVLGAAQRILAEAFPLPADDETPDE